MTLLVIDRDGTTRPHERRRPRRASVAEKSIPFWIILSLITVLALAANMLCE